MGSNEVQRDDIIFSGFNQLSNVLLEVSELVSVRKSELGIFWPNVLAFILEGPSLLKSGSLFNSVVVREGFLDESSLGASNSA